MKKRHLITAGIIVTLALFVSWFSITGYRRGRADFEAVSEGRPPIYATHFAGLLDGGTEWYRGRGYSVYRMHRILMAAGIQKAAQGIHSSKAKTGLKANHQ